MTLPKTINDRKYQSFVEVGTDVAVRVSGTANNLFGVLAKKIYYVNMSAPNIGIDTNSGADWSNALLTIQAAIDKAVDKEGTIIYIRGSATVAAGAGGIGIVVNKENIALIGAGGNGAECPSNGHCSITWLGGFGGGGLTAGNFAAINIAKSKVRLENMRITVTSIDYPVCIQNVTNANSQLYFNNLQLIVNGTSTGSAIRFTTASSYSTFRNLNLFGGTGATGKMNQAVYGSSSYSRWDNIMIRETEGAALVIDCFGSWFNNITVFPSCATGLTISDATNIVSNSIVLAAGAKLPGHTALNVNVKLAVD